MKLKQGVGIIITWLILLPALSSLSLALMDEVPFYEEFVLERGILRKGIIEKFFLPYLNELKGFYETHLLELVERNPDPFHPPNQAIISYLIFILEPLTILALLIVGLYLILLSGTPWGRAFSKSLLPGLILALLLIPLSSYLIFLFLGLTHLLTSEIFSLSPQDPVRMFTQSLDFLIQKFSQLNEVSFLFPLPFLFFVLTLLLLTLLLLVIRYLMVTLFTILFPLTIFLYLFIPTRELGKRFLELTISWTLAQVVIALALVSISGVLFLLPSTLSPEIRVTLETAGNLILILITLGSVILLRNYLPG